MAKILSKLKSSISLLSLLLIGCMPAVVVPVAAVATAKATNAVVEERSAGDRVDDGVIVTKINAEYAKAEFKDLFLKITVNSWEGRVMLTGSVLDNKSVTEAVNLAWTIPHVKEVINELRVEDKDLSDKAKDLAVKTKINAKLLAEKHLKSSNYIVDVNNGVVYLLGVAQNKAELDKAMHIIKNTDGVAKVVNHVLIKGEVRSNS